ncbi:hypothetical protein TOPH_07349 [Tolypocladium ophioglossoides CBS 100239]|uniref:Uncharacterized protein n=1 Tax=Tolypocladium ophioglossoides (strain CBS 100239) TaxID=1163406 RepID=A0A0L0N1M4_TOLOC|nr:hypothetical protein TOPH_07349 [Tolypocladium ophioglossoides CBS 100239]
MKSLLIYPLLALLGAIREPSYEHLNSATLSLPISPALTIVAVMLPFLAAINAIFYPRLRRWASSTAARRVLAITLQALHLGHPHHGPGDDAILVRHIALRCPNMPPVDDLATSL